jgi:AcrR family transcriptional regulator
MPRNGLTTAAVVDAAVKLADSGGVDQLTLVRVAARLKVQPPSLFNHVRGLPDLRRQLQLRGLEQMTQVVTRAAVGRAGADAVLAGSTAIRKFAHEHPGLYAVSLPSTPLSDPELNAAGQRFVGIFFELVREWGFKGNEAVHAVRGLFATVHGFIMLERAGNFGMPINVDDSFRWLVQRYIDALKRRSR